MKNKSFVNMIEMIITVIILYVAFNVFFPGFSYKTKWNEAILLQTTRDVILTMDRTNRLYGYSFSLSAIKNFLNETISESNIISWSDTEGIVKNQITIACNCTLPQMVNLNNWLAVKINGRSIEPIQCYTNLESINPCIISSDVLVIWGSKKVLSDQVYYNTLKGYLKGDGGIVEVADLDQIDIVQREIFGLKEGGAWGSPTYDIIIKPETANNVTYQAYKIYLNGLKGNSTITEFCKDLPTKHIIPLDEDESKIFVQIDKKGLGVIPASCAIFNTTRIAWMADFSGITYDGNHTKLLTSLILAVSNKRLIGASMPSIKTGYITSYVNVNNTDMFEVYNFNLGLGYPY